ncbi:MAG: ATP synthase F1 subunit delta [Phycisphaerae bacterium]|nr:ATP synthase F1 subunit delta [Phycisphaerae bacterium]
MASEHEVSQTAADIYAESLLELANERGVTDAIFEEFQSLAEYIEGDEAFERFLASSAVDDDDRREVLRRIFTGRASEMLLNLMLVLNDHGRAGIVPLVFDRFKQRLDIQKNRQDVQIRSAVPLADNLREEIRSRVASATGKEPILFEEVDPSLIGGLVVKVGDRQFDGSLKRKLARLREELVDRGDLEILSGRHNAPESP